MYCTTLWKFVRQLSSGKNYNTRSEDEMKTKKKKPGKYAYDIFYELN